MTWLTALWVTAFIALIAALTGLQPSGGRRVANTHLMAVARGVLVLMAIILAWFAYHAR